MINSEILSFQTRMSSKPVILPTPPGCKDLKQIQSRGTRSLTVNKVTQPLLSRQGVAPLEAILASSGSGRECGNHALETPRIWRLLRRQG